MLRVLGPRDAITTAGSQRHRGGVREGCDPVEPGHGGVRNFVHTA